MARMIQTLFKFAAFGLEILIAVSAMPDQAFATSPSHNVVIEFDPDTRSLTVRDRVSGSSDAITLDRADWLEVDELRIGGELVGVPVGPTLVSPGLLNGQALEISLHGRISNTPSVTSRFGAFPTGAFLFGAQGWLPSASDGSEIYDVRLSVPASHRGIVTGVLREESEVDGSYIATFRFEGDGDHLAVLFGPYLVEETFLDNVRLRTYFTQQHAGEASAYLEAVKGYIARYQRTIGDYPYTSFSVVSAPIPVGYGLDAMTYVSERILGHPYMRGRSLAHEILHSWWGGGVRIDYERGNWGEGLTTYQADYALAVESGVEAALDMRREWLRSLSTLPNALDSSVRTFRSASHNGEQAIGYGKVAMIFHMLRRELGETAFNAGIRAFWQSNRGRRADWEDLQTAFETASDRDLNWFFSQWLDRPGLPALSLGKISRRKTADGHELTVMLWQADPHYRLSVPIEIETEVGVKRHDVRFDNAEVLETFVLDGRPLAVQLDPGFDVARKLPLGELPASLREAMRTTSSVLILPAAHAFSESAIALKTRLVPTAELINLEQIDKTKDVALVIGLTAQIAAFRDTILDGASPAVATQGQCRAWAERDTKDRLWWFISADEAADLDRLVALRYYGSKSFAVFAKGREAITGTWPVFRNPLRRSLD